LSASTLAPAGRDAELIAALVAWMAPAALVIWLCVIGLALLARRGGFSPRTGRLIVGAGVVIPVVLLTALVLYGLPVLPRVLALPPPGGLVIEVTGEQWWWRVRYHPPDGPAFDLANELRLPVGRRIEVRLRSADVIHAFWVPALAGKIDMIPGRVTRLALEPTQPGTYRGICAEYCGASHARMNFEVVVVGEASFGEWTRAQTLPAAEPTDPLAARGAEVFRTTGCGACHTIRGTPADGGLAPDLTHVGSRARLAAGLLPNTPDAAVRWIARTHALKPGAPMPAFDMLPPEDLEALARYLAELR
jgi:cytochrome c oxidase subunit 2